MKFKELLFALGVKPKPRTYKYELISFDLPKDGTVNYAKWLHPKISGDILDQGRVDEIRRFLNPGDVAIDIGAHTGDSSLPIALAVGSEGCVIALEPNPYVFDVLKANANLNRDKTNILPLMIAATPSDGPIEFEYSDAGFCNGGRHEGMSFFQHGHAFKLTVEGRNLDEYLRNHYLEMIHRIRYVKVDAEGYDYRVLQSLLPLLKENRPYIKAEVFSRTGEIKRQAMIEFLEDLGYSIYRVIDEGNYKGEPVSRSDVMRWRHYDIFCVPSSVPSPLIS